MKRYSLRVLLVVATLLALFLGYSQQRRRTILNECAALKADLVQVAVPNTLIDKVWQRTPTNIVVPANVYGGLDSADERARLRLERLGWKYRRVALPMPAGALD